MTDAEIAYEIAKIEKLKIVYTSEDSLLVEPFEGTVREYDPVNDDALMYYLQCKYKVSVDFRMNTCSIESKWESYRSGWSSFLEGKSPSRAICEAIIDAREEFE